MRYTFGPSICILLIGLTTFGPMPLAFGRGGGRGGGGGGRGGGGMSRPSGGMSRPSGGMSRPSGGISRPSSPSMSRPSAPISRPSGGGVSRPGGVNPGIGAGSRPGGGGLQPGSRPGTVDFNRPSPGLTPGSRPAIGTLPSNPGINRPGIGPGPGPGIGNPGVRPGGPGIANPGVRPGGPGIGNPGIGPGSRPGIRPDFPGVSTGALPGLGNRPGFDGSRREQRPANAQDRRNNLQDRLSDRGDRQDNRQDNRGDRQDNRQANRGDRQDNRNDRRDDWHDHMQDWHDHHGDWHHGCWDGNGSWWNHMWDEHTALMAFGTTMWGINRAAYAFGYWGYSNPYYTESYPVGGDVYVDYSQPINVDAVPAEAQAAPGAPEPPVPGMNDFNAARQSFYEGTYAQALASCNKALAAMPNDPIMHEFRALIQFAQGKYKESAAGLYSVLSVGPGWDWTTMSSLYSSVDVYTRQLRALESYLEKNPQANDARFVLAYHYLTAGSKDAAGEQYKALYKATPQDNLIKQLALMTAGPDAVAAAVAKEPAKTPVATIDATTLQGKWAAAGPSGAKFNMELTKEGTFTWSFAQNGKTQSVKGVYALDGNTLAMEMDAGGTMLADITPPQNGGFSFQMLGAPPGDPGLKFAAVK